MRNGNLISSNFFPSFFFSREKSDAGPVTTSNDEQPLRLPPNYEQATNSEIP